jgi:hypothetical protein
MSRRVLPATAVTPLQVAISAEANVERPQRGGRSGAGHHKRAAAPRAQQPGHPPLAPGSAPDKASAEQDSAKARRDQDALLPRGAQHLASFVAALHAHGGPLEASRRSCGTLSVALLQVRSWAARYHWASFREATQRREISAAQEHLLSCALACAAAAADPCDSLSAVLSFDSAAAAVLGEAQLADECASELSLHLAHCPSASVISAGAIERAIQQLGVLEVVNALTACNNVAMGQRAVLQQLQPALVDAPQEAAARLFKDPQAHAAALAHLLALLRPGWDASRAQPADQEPRGSTGGGEATGAVPAPEGVVPVSALDGPDLETPPLSAAPDDGSALAESEVFWARVACCVAYLGVALPQEQALQRCSQLLRGQCIDEIAALVRHCQNASV